MDQVPGSCRRPDVRGRCDALLRRCLSLPREDRRRHRGPAGLHREAHPQLGWPLIRANFQLLPSARTASLSVRALPFATFGHSLARKRRPNHIESERLPFAFSLSKRDALCVSFRLCGTSRHSVALKRNALSTARAIRSTALSLPGFISYTG